MSIVFSFLSYDKLNVISNFIILLTFSKQKIRKISNSAKYKSVLARPHKDNKKKYVKEYFGYFKRNGMIKKDNILAVSFVWNAFNYIILSNQE